ncbi:MAG: hypothetical protein N2554_04900 [Fimbriimonadales bacterium]|nr:hypothetical protein [Fimbriimonadales bacterium]
MRGWQLLLTVSLLLGQTPTAGWREAFSESRCDVAICKCRDCAGGANCCCAKARTPLEQAMALSQCDRAEQQQLALSGMPRVIFTTELIIPAPQLAFLPYVPLYLSPLYRSIVPRSPPPRSSFRLPVALPVARTVLSVQS